MIGFLASEDCLNTLAAVEALGAAVERDGTTITITGTNDAPSIGGDTNGAVTEESSLTDTGTLTITATRI